MEASYHVARTAGSCMVEPRNDCAAKPEKTFAQLDEMVIFTA